MPPSPVRGASWKARKRRRCRTFFEAAEGTRTLDLLHGKQTSMARFMRLLPANDEVSGFGSAMGLVAFRRVLRELCQPIVNRRIDARCRASTGPPVSLRHGWRPSRPHLGGSSVKRAWDVGAALACRTGWLTVARRQGGMLGRRVAARGGWLRRAPYAGSLRAGLRGEGEAMIVATRRDLLKRGRGAAASSAFSGAGCRLACSAPARGRTPSPRVAGLDR